jgi:hypothetical protein
VLVGPSVLGVLDTSSTVAVVLLLPGVTCFAAVVSSLISSRVATFNAAQQLGGLVLLPVWAVVFSAAATLRDRGPVALFAAAFGLLLLDATLAVVAAATWRREEVLARR